MTNNATGAGLTPVIVFRNHAERTVEVCYSPSSNFTDPNDDIYDFVVENGDQNAWNYLNKGGRYSHSPPPPQSSRATAPDLSGFAKALRAEPKLSSEIRVGLSWLLRPSSFALSDPAALQQDWQDSVAIHGSSWLTSAVQKTIMNHATKYNIPLVANS